MAQGFYGSYFGNAGALNNLVYRGEPVQFQTLPYYGSGFQFQTLPYYGGGFNVQPLMAGNPFSSDFVIPGAKRQQQPVLPGGDPGLIRKVYGGIAPMQMPVNPLLPGSSKTIIRGV